VEIGGAQRNLPLLEVTPGVRLAVFNLLGDTEVVEAAARQTLYLDEKDRDLVRGRRIVLVDDVISTGSTVEAMRRLMEQAGTEVVAEAAVFTKGADKTGDVLGPGHLRLFESGG
jgi:adenine phosphoribosyltransferase